MDRYVLVLSLCPRVSECPDGFKPLEEAEQIYEGLGRVSCEESQHRLSAFPACSLSGRPSAQRCYFAVQAVQGSVQYCSSEWEEVWTSQQKGDSEEESPSALQLCLSSLQDQEGDREPQEEQAALAELFEEAAEGLHLLSDKLPPPGKALVDVLVVCGAPRSPALKDLLPLMGALKHMGCWHAAKITLVTRHADGWQTVASSLSAAVIEPPELDGCIDPREQWRGALLIREKKCASELRFEGFSLRTVEAEGPPSSSVPAGPHLQPEVFHYYRNVLDLMQVVSLTDLPAFLLSNTEFQLRLSGKSKKCRLLLDQLCSLQGKVGALFCLSCVVTPVAQPPPGPLGSRRWRETLAQRPGALPAPEVEVKGEAAHYFLLVRGSEDGTCGARMLHSANQINGAAAVATVNGLLREKSLLSSEPGGQNEGGVLDSLPGLHGDDVRKATRAQTLVLKECLKRQADASPTATVPLTHIKALLHRAREQYLNLTTAPCLLEAREQDLNLTTAPCLLEAREQDLNLTTAPCLPEDRQRGLATPPGGPRRAASQRADWPERSVLHNVENLRRRRQKNRFTPGSGDGLLGPKDGQRVSLSLDARELLKHFTVDGAPAGDLQPLVVCRGSNMFRLSPDLSPGRVSRMPFSKASSSHYHGLEFCLDERRALDRDLGLARLQSRLIRFETRTTCSKEPLPFALSPAPVPSPAVASEPGSAPDGETLAQNADVGRIKHRPRRAHAALGHPPRKRLAGSESSDSLCSQSSGSGSGTHPSVRSLRQQPIRSQSTSASTVPGSLAPPTRRTSSVTSADMSSCRHQGTPGASTGAHEDQPATESRSQKHHRMLKEVVAKALSHRGVTAEHKSFGACSQRLFEISKFYLKDLKTSRGLHDEMKKAAKSNAQQVIDWVLEKQGRK